MERKEIAKEVDRILEQHNVNSGVIAELQQLSNADDPAAELGRMLAPQDVAYTSIWRDVNSSAIAALHVLLQRIKTE